MKNDEFWIYVICHTTNLLFRLAVVSAVLWLTWEMNNAWILFGLVGAMVGYKHDYKTKQVEK